MDTILVFFLVLIVFAYLLRAQDAPIQILPQVYVKEGRGHRSYPRHHRRRGYRADHHDLPLVIGGEKDRHGCLRSAGYSWDVEQQKCTRPWISHLN